MALAHLKKTRLAEFRIVVPTLAIATQAGKKLAVRVPRDALVTLTTPIVKDSLVNVTWEGQTITMFSQDLRACGELVIPFGHT